MDYFTRVERGNYEDLTWNIPEQKQGIVNIIGGFNVYINEDIIY